jgi:hypothetical protein
MPGKRRKKGLFHQKKTVKTGVVAYGRRRKGGARRRAQAARPARSNPVIGDSALELSYTGGEGKRKGKLRGPWKHDFESNDVEVRGRKDGSIVLRSKTGKRLWDFFEV